MGNLRDTSRSTVPTSLTALTKRHKYAAPLRSSLTGVLPTFKRLVWRTASAGSWFEVRNPPSVPKRPHGKCRVAGATGWSDFRLLRDLQGIIDLNNQLANRVDMGFLEEDMMA